MNKLVLEIWNRVKARVCNSDEETPDFIINELNIVEEALNQPSVYDEYTNPNLRKQFEECVKEVFGDVDKFLDLIDSGGIYEKFDAVAGNDRPDDEYYVIDRKTGEYINWYKYTHIGRSIHMNFNPEKMKDFLTRFKESEGEMF